MKIDVNVDMGESFGRYVLGNDEELMKYISSANVATCFHAGDPLVMEQTIKWAKEYDVAVGAHLGLPDKQGFGRREMDLTADELRSDTLYQLGAIDGVLKVYGMKMQHVKPHGILYRMVSENEKYIDTFLQTVKDYNPDLFIMLPPNTPAFERGKEMGLKMVGEALIDLSYDEEGNWVIERTKKARSPEEVAERAVTVARDKKIATIGGKMIDIDALTVCIHGDAPNAVDEAKVVKEILEKNDIEIANLFEIA
ncbi:MAG TPA: LamB/YcsF family protein [Candidatus Copromorpha excrementigallinarum]|uniref:LamB/YcsF family protein n=1 Tax=Candidatus Allocopromorpha excrementigallinarum TaxID=2840742 RepID=A0A9D1I1C5_9FIRM|nr:LamB/YcsF family protein [Candidatus Copromorpha excrementigallinarum]